MPTILENLEKLDLPKLALPVVSASVVVLANRLGLTLVLTCPSAPEQYAVTRNGQRSGDIRVRWGGMSVDYPDSGDESLYQGTVDGFGGFTDHEREAKLLFALGVIAARMMHG